MRAKFSARTRIAIIALTALAPLADGSADAQFFHGGGGFGNLTGGSWHSGHLGGEGSHFFGPGLGGGGFNVDPVWNDNLGGGDGPHPKRTPVGGGWPPPKHRRQIVVTSPPPVIDEPDEPVYPTSRPRHPRVIEKPPAHQPTFAYAKPPVLTRPPNPPAFPSRAAPPPAGETRYRAGEVLVEIPFTAAWPPIADVLRRHRLIQAEAVPINLLGISLQRWRTADARTVPAIIAELGAESALVRVQPNYLYSPTDDVAPASMHPAALEAPASPKAPEAQENALFAQEYALSKMKVAPSLETSDAAPIRVAVIDTDIDDTHPDLKGVVEQRFDAIKDGAPTRSKTHGTAMAGGIAANGQLRGVATRVKILSVRAFDVDATNAQSAGGEVGSTLSIVEGINWSAENKAQVVNMSFAGPNDPTLHDALAAAYAAGIALVSAAGNLGPSAPPQYPGADADVIAATAVDSEDKLFSGANVGTYVAISAPGVDVLLPSPEGGYTMETGTSVASALVSGVVALMLEHNSSLKPGAIRDRLKATAAPLGGPEHAKEFGAGLVDAAKAVSP